MYFRTLIKKLIEEMSRYKLTIEYNGTRYSGWQMQKGGKSVQGEIMDACNDLFGSAKSDVYGAGRTDAGVHALGQVAHIDAETDMPEIRIRYGINDRLPPDICILNVEKKDPDFHARHNAVARSYIYQISTRRTAFGKKYVWWIKDELDPGKMDLASKHFVGFKDFRSFTDETLEQSSTKIEIKHTGISVFDDMIVFHVIGSHFIWKQVRRMTGVLVEVGRGNIRADDIDSFLRKRSDVPAKFTAPPSGLFLERVYYPGDRINYETHPMISIGTFGSK